MDHGKLASQLQNVKSKIEAYIEGGHLSEAKMLIDGIDRHKPWDLDICSMRAVICIIEGDLDKAESILIDGLKKDSIQFDLLFNLAYVYEQKGHYQKAGIIYRKALTVAVTNDHKQNLKLALERVRSIGPAIELEDKTRLVIFIKEGVDGFLDDIINGLDEEFLVRKMLVNDYRQIDVGMEWADICWFEWCDELIVYGSKRPLAKVKKMICRLHSYEAFTDFIIETDWKQIDKVIFIAEHIRNFVLANQQLLKPEQTCIIANGINLEQFSFTKRKPGYNIAYIGYLNYKKGTMLLLHTFKTLYDRDHRYKLHIAGIFQDVREKLYFNQMSKEFGIEDNIVFDGWQNDLNTWMEDKNYILCTSLLESQNISVMQAMCKGIKPIIHNFVGAKGIYPKKYLWNTIEEAIGMIVSDTYHSQEYVEFVKDNFSLNEKILSLKRLLTTLSKCIHKGAGNLLYFPASDHYNKYKRFSPYNVTQINNYDFSTSRITIGKKELIEKDRETIEFTLINSSGKRLIITDIVHDLASNRLFMPEYISRSHNGTSINKYCSEILQNTELKYDTNGIAGFVLSEELKNDIEANHLVYLWERAFPTSEFMPYSGFCTIMNRYELAARYINEGSNVLDAASGFGYGSSYLAGISKGSSITALDIAEENIHFGISAYDFSSINWVLGDVTNLPFDKDSFDTYISYETMEHLSLELVDTYLSEALRVLKKDGVFIVSTPNKAARYNINNPFHIKEYTCDELDALISRFFSTIDYFSLSNNEYKKGMDTSSANIIAVCRNS